MRIHLATAMLVSMAACTTPDISVELDAANKLMGETGKTLRTKLSAKAKDELTALENTFYRENQPVVEITGTCDPNSARAKGLARSDCELRSLVDPGEDKTNATAVLQAVTVLEGYFAALTGLSKTKGTDEIKKQAKALTNALVQTGQIQADSFQQISEAAKEHSDAVVAVAGFAANQHQVSKLRQVVRKADPVVGDMTMIAVSYLDASNPELVRAADEVSEAEKAVNDAQIANDPVAHKRSVERLRKAFNAFKKAEANTLSAGLLNLRKLHAKLLQRLNGTGSMDEIEALLDDITELYELIKK